MAKQDGELVEMQATSDAYDGRAHQLLARDYAWTRRAMKHEKLQRGKATRDVRRDC
jgi:hypothetical protein